MIIDWIKSLFHKKPDEIVKLKEIIEKQKQEKEQLQKDLDKLLSRKRISKKSTCRPRCSKFFLKTSFMLAGS